MTKQFLRDSLIWGVALWLIGYILGFIFFAMAPANLIGWYIMPFGIVITLFVAYKFIKSNNLQDYLKVACIWTILAIVLDYIFLVKLLNPTDGYYKLDVYVYYSLTFILPILVGWYKIAKFAK
ncbi:MAG: hypothetical protein WC460_01245 [Patescibacteria group bacterium]